MPDVPRRLVDWQPLPPAEHTDRDYAIRRAYPITRASSTGGVLVTAEQIAELEIAIDPKRTAAMNLGANCPACPLSDDREYGCVSSTGPVKADIAVVGQNPGQNEIRTGKPFIGASGKLLDQVLKHYKLDRSQMLVTNACLCVHRKENIKPPATAVSACRPRLIQELKNRGVKQVINLGAVPAQGLFGVRDTISSLRVGTSREVSDLPNVQVYSTFHPAACLRSAGFFPSLVADFGKLVNPPPPWREPKYVVWEDPDLAIRGIREMGRRHIDVITLDLEWSTPQDKDVSFDHPYRYKLLCIGMAYAADKAVVIGKQASQSPLVLEELRLYLQTCKRIITQNGKSDKQGAYSKGFDFTFTDDTMLKNYIQDERPGIHGLKVQLEEMLGYPRYGDEIKQYLGKGKARSFANIPLPILYKYNAFDTCGTFALDEHHNTMLAADDYAEPILPRADGERWGLVRLHQFMVETANNLAYVELNGHPVDLKYNAELTKKYDKILLDLENDMFKTLEGLREDPKFNPRSPLQLKAIFAELGVPLPMVRRPNGTMSTTTDAATLNDLFDKYKKIKNPVLQATAISQADNAIGAEVFEVDTRSREVRFLEALLAYRKAAKTNGTYVRGLKKHVWKGRVFPTVMIHSTVSGRTSQKRPSLQVIPHAEEIKRQFTVADYHEWRYGITDKPWDDYHLLAEFDFKQIELRVLTWLAQEPYFREVFSDPTRDLFTELASVVKPERSAKTNMHPKDRRNIVKAFVYGLAYGREAGSIADEYGIPLGVAQAMMRDFFAVIPNIVKFREAVKKQCISQDDLVTPFGRRRRFMLVTPENKKDIQNEALSFYPQSIASDICIQAFDYLRPKLKGVAWCRNLVHDALFWEFKEKDLEYVAHTVQQAMIQSAYNVMGDYVRIDVDCEIGRTWGDMIHLEEWQAGKRPYSSTLALKDQWI
jgi:uracil-DNA glycosylase family 4